MATKKIIKKKSVAGKKRPSTVKEKKCDERHYPTRPLIGVGVVIWRDDKVLLVKRGRPPRQDEWGLPGGVQKLGETIMEAAAREAREETGLDIAPLGIVTALDAVIKDKAGRIEYHYTLIETVADALPGKAKAGDDVKELVWVSIDEIEPLCAWHEVLRVVRLSLLQRAL